MRQEAAKYLTEMLQPLNGPFAETDVLVEPKPPTQAEVSQLAEAIPIIAQLKRVLHRGRQAANNPQNKQFWQHIMDDAKANQKELEALEKHHRANSPKTEQAA